MSEHVMNRMTGDEMTEDEYRKDPGVNKSTLWEIRKSPAHYRWAVDHQGEEEDTPAMKLGRAVHMAVLQPNEFVKHYAVAPDVDRRTKEGKAAYAQFLAEHEGCEVLTEDEFDTVNEMAKSVRRTTFLEPTMMAKTEMPMFWDDPRTGIRCKGRVDAIVPICGKVIVADLKTTTDASTEAFTRDAIRMGYHVQAAHYMNGIRETAGFRVPTEWWFVAVEKKPPYAVNVIKMSDAMLDAGQFKLMELMDRLDECLRNDEWPGYGSNEMVPPAWMTEGDE